MTMIGTKEKRKLYYILLTAISILFMGTRLFRLDSVPFTSYGMELDELGAAYDAWCIQGWGVDRYLTGFPVYFLNTGEGQNALYIYLAAIMFKLFGFTLFKFRLIAVICASFAYICLYYLSAELIGDEFFRLIPNILMTITPVYMMSEHWGLEAYLFLSFAIISFFFFQKAFKSGKIGDFIISGVLWGITFYTYGISYIVLPLFMILILIYLLYLKKVNFSQIMGMAVPMIIFGIPLALEQFVIMGIIEPFSLGRMDFRPVKIARWGDIAFKYIPENIRRFPIAIFVWDGCFYNAAPVFGTIYYISIPFMLVGFILVIKKTIRSVRENSYDIYTIIFLFFIAAQTVLLMTRNLNINTANVLFFPYLIFTSEGIIFVIKKTNRKAAAFVIAAVYIVVFLFFAKWMYSNGEFSWNYSSRPRTEEYIVEDIHTGLAIQEAKRICGGRHRQMMINDVEGRYQQICLFAGTSPYDYNGEGYSENGYDIGIPEEIDLSGDTVYLIEDDLHHITDYLVSEGFINQPAKQGGFSVVYKAL